jgi:hypothetical protein
MTFNLKIEVIIQHNIFTERNIIDWNEYKNNIINNFNNIDFNEKIENYEPPTGRLLHVSRPKMREILHNSIVFNKKIFKEVGYEEYRPREQYNFTFYDICDFIEECVKILVKKQQLKT